MKGTELCVSVLVFVCTCVGGWGGGSWEGLATSHCRKPQLYNIHKLFLLHAPCVGSPYRFRWQNANHSLHEEGGPRRKGAATPKVHWRAPHPITAPRPRSRRGMAAVSCSSTSARNTLPSSGCPESAVPSALTAAWQTRCRPSVAAGCQRTPLAPPGRFPGSFPPSSPQSMQVSLQKSHNHPI